MRGKGTGIVVAVALAAAVAVAAFGLVTASDARQSAQQKSFRKLLLADSEVDPAVKTLLREGGFVERRAVFADFTGEGKTDAIVFVNSGAISGTVASYVLSAERGRELHIVKVDESGYQVNARASGRGETERLVIEDPVFATGDPPCCARTLVRRTYAWDTADREFRLVSRKRVRSGVRITR